MAKWPTKQATLDADAHKALLDLQKALGSQRLTREANLREILGALVMYTSPPAAAGMLLEYRWYIEKREQARDADEGEAST